MSPKVLSSPRFCTVSYRPSFLLVPSGAILISPFLRGLFVAILLPPILSMWVYRCYPVIANPFYVGLPLLSCYCSSFLLVPSVANLLSPILSTSPFLCYPVIAHTFYVGLPLLSCYCIFFPRGSTVAILLSNILSIRAFHCYPVIAHPFTWAFRCYLVTAYTFHVGLLLLSCYRPSFLFVNSVAILLSPILFTPPFHCCPVIAHPYLSMPSTLSATAGCVQSLHINLASGLRNPSHCASSL